MDGMLQHSKPIFSKLKILNVFNLYNYITACEAMKIVDDCIPKTIYELYTISNRSYHFILPRIRLNTIMKHSFIYQSMKILNYLLQNDINYNELSISIFKCRLKRHLLYNQCTENYGNLKSQLHLIKSQWIKSILIKCILMRCYLIM